MLTLLAAFALASLDHPFFERPLLMGAHRGGVLAWPENTVYAFEQCAKGWPDMLLETDIRMTRDGVPILLHDDTIDRTTNGRGRPEDMTLAELQGYDAGYRFTRDGGQSFPYRGKGLVVPTLEAALRATPNHRWLLDIKPTGDVAAIVDVVRKVGAEKRVLVASFVPAKMAELRRLAPDWPTCFDYANGLGLTWALRGSTWEQYQPPAQVLSIMKEDVERFSLTPEEIRKIRAKGILFQIHTLNTADEIRYWLEVGVDSILTDDPALLAREIAVFRHRQGSG